MWTTERRYGPTDPARSHDDGKCHTPASDRPKDAARRRAAILITGVVQGVGFRPFVYALAQDLALSGSVSNSAGGVSIDIEGQSLQVEEFLSRLTAQPPPLSRVDSVVVQNRRLGQARDFVIAASDPVTGGVSVPTLISPDIATCADCLAELRDPTNRRYRHPFISCTNCGPRFTIIRTTPYDRATTTMVDLPLCAACAHDYANPADRRFHAQTVACPDCGPTLRLVRDAEPDVIGDAAVTAARALLAAGAIVAVKGLGGYHLACDAGDEVAVSTLRKRKDRGDKPFAVMLASLDAASEFVHLEPAAAAQLDDIRRPVVLVPTRPDAPLARSVTPHNPELGVMLAYTPVHHLLLEPPGPRALVMTSGNLRGEPIATDDAEARTRLAGVADAWLMHDRAIHVPCDDSVVRGDGAPVRRSRGFAPMPITLPVTIAPALAVGGDVKNTFCLGAGRQAWMSAHVGDMDDLATLTAFETATEHLADLTGVRAERVIADAHPSYRSSAWARRRDPAVTLVQHHHAHIASAMADAGHDGTSPVLGFAFDGTGYGTDGAAWGGEVLRCDYDGFERLAHLRYVSLPGGDAGVRHPCRMALSHLDAAGVDWDPQLPSVAACTAQEREVVRHQLRTGLGCVPTSSMGRLFDALSSLVGLCHRIDYEAEAAMRFEALAAPALESSGTAYTFDISGSDLNAGPVVVAAARDVLAGVDPGVIAARFHHAVAAAVVAVAQGSGETTVALSGGVFLNVVLTRLCRAGLQDAGFTVLTHRQVPPSDAGIALGQLVVGARERAGQSCA